jgi:hypothetical protein
MTNVELQLQQKKDGHNLKPEFFDLSLPADQDKITELLNTARIQSVIDDYEEEQLELFGVKNPTKVYTPNFKQEFQEYYKNIQQEKPIWQHGLWVLYPWLCKLVHILPEPDFFFVVFLAFILFCFLFFHIPWLCVDIVFSLEELISNILIFS